MKGDERLLGACDGYAQAMILLKRRAGAIVYHMPPAHHTRKRAALLARYTALMDIYNELEPRLRSCQAIYRGTTDPSVGEAVVPRPLTKTPSEQSLTPNPDGGKR